MRHEVPNFRHLYGSSVAWIQLSSQPQALPAAVHRPQRLKFLALDVARLSRTSVSTACEVYDIVCLIYDHSLVPKSLRGAKHATARHSGQVPRANGHPGGSGKGFWSPHTPLLR